MSALYIGLMSGTSMDGVDAVLCAMADTRFERVVATHTAAYPASLRQRLLALQSDLHPIALHDFAALDESVADVFAEAVRALLMETQHTATQISAIGSHGQTIFHDPRGARSSLQLGDPNRIAARTGITTVADFRRKDIALGGQGAPLVPAFHRAVFQSERESRCALNLGGIANITLLPVSGSVRGFDTGPGNALMDAWAQSHLQQPFDGDGAYAASGTLNDDLLNALLADEYFAAPEPKSTGRDYFNLDWARKRFPPLDTLPPADVQRSFGELTARSIVQALQSTSPETQRLIVCGGGVRNLWLMQRLQDLSQLPVERSDAHGLDAQTVEGAAFAWLAMRTLHQLPGNLPAVTGASREAVLGGIYTP